MKFLKIFSIFLFLLISSTPILASGTVEEIEEEVPVTETTTISDSTTKFENKYFDLVLTRGPQSAFDNSVPYTLQITPHIDSQKTQIIWSIPSTLLVSPKHKEFLSMQNGVTYTVKANIKALKAGTYDFTVSVISWQYDTNYTNSAKDSLTFDRALVLQPTSSEYVFSNIVKYLIIFAIFGGLVFLVIRLSKTYSKKAKQWLTPPY